MGIVVRGRTEQIKVVFPHVKFHRRILRQPFALGLVHPLTVGGILMEECHAGLDDGISLRDGLVEGISLRRRVLFRWTALRRGDGDARHLEVDCSIGSRGKMRDAVLRLLQEVFLRYVDHDCQ